MIQDDDEVRLLYLEQVLGEKDMMSFQLLRTVMPAVQPYGMAVVKKDLIQMKS